MTTSVTVRPRARGAIVTIKTISQGDEGHNVEDEVFELGQFDDRQFDLKEGQEIVVREKPQPATESELEQATVAAGTTGKVKPTTRPTLEA